MSSEQMDAYAGETTVHSDPCGLIQRNNRNHRKKQQLIKAVMAARPGDTVLEVGCGDGIHAREWAKKFDHIGVDISHSLCQQTAARGSEAVQCDATSLPFADGAVAAVVGNGVLHHIPTPRTALSEWIRVAQGSVTVTEPNYLFPKAFVDTHVVPEERHKTMMAPWRIKEIVHDVARSTGWTWRIEPVIYTPPWPRRLHGLYDRIDAAFRRLPGIRWSAQMMRIHFEP